ERRRIGLPVQHVPGHGRNVLRSGASFLQDAKDVLQCLPDLAGQIMHFKLALSVPADLAANIDGAASRLDTVCIADRLCPSLRLEPSVRCTRSRFGDAHRTSIWTSFALVAVSTSHHFAAGNCDGLPGDCGRAVANQPEHGVGYFVWRHEPSLRVAAG